MNIKTCRFATHHTHTDRSRRCSIHGWKFVHAPSSARSRARCLYAMCRKPIELPEPPPPHLTDKTPGLDGSVEPRQIYNPPRSAQMLFETKKKKERKKERKKGRALFMLINRSWSRRQLCRLVLRM